MFTEDQAKTKECPFMREEACSASRCMAWRWGGRVRIEHRVYHKSEDHRALNKARFGKGIVHAFEFKDHKWKYRHTGFDDDGEYDVIERENPSAEKVGCCGRLNDFAANF